MSWSRRASRTSRGGGGEGVGRALARRLAESTSTAEALRSTVETLRSDVEQKQTALRDVAAIREEEGRVAAERVEAAKREAKTAKREAKTAKREAKTLRDEVETLRDEVETLRDEKKTLHDEKKTLHDDASRQRRFATPSRDWRRRRWRFVFRSTTRRDPATRSRANATRSATRWRRDRLARRRIVFDCARRFCR